LRDHAHEPFDSISFHSSCPDVTRDLRSRFAATGLRSQTVRRRHYAYYYPAGLGGVHQEVP